jgi:hypothetical protein
MGRKETKQIIAIADKLRKFAEDKALILTGFDHIGSVYEPAPNATFANKDNTNLQVTLPFWLIKRLGGEI